MIFSLVGCASQFSPEESSGAICEKRPREQFFGIGKEVQELFTLAGTRCDRTIAQVLCRLGLTSAEMGKTGDSPAKSCNN
jgi:hypothetical protein